MEKSKIFALTDHTRLNPCATREEVDQTCHEAVTYGMAAACIPPRYVKAMKAKYGQALKVCTVVGFPLGYSSLESKVFETEQAIRDGADEIDMVISLGDAKEGRFDEITAEIAAVKAACKGKILKVIIETCYLNEEEKIALCACVTEARADFIKTSTGFGPAGANPADIELFKQHIGRGILIKAAGGIRTREAMEDYINRGCTRVGASGALTACKDNESTI